MFHKAFNEWFEVPLYAKSTIMVGDHEVEVDISSPELVGACLCGCGEVKISLDEYQLAVEQYIEMAF